MSAPMPSVPSATRSPSSAKRRPPHPVVHVRPRVVRDARPRVAHQLASRARPGARSARGACGRPARRRSASRSATRTPNRASASRSSAASSAAWTWIPAPVSRARSTHAASVSSESVKEACAPTIPRARGARIAGEEPPALRHARGGALGTVPVGHLVAEDRAQAYRPERVRDHVRANRRWRSATRGGRRASSCPQAAPPSRRPAPTSGRSPRRARGRAATTPAAGSRRSSWAARARTACRARAPSTRACARRRSRE